MVMIEMLDYDNTNNIIFKNLQERFTWELLGTRV
jgi:hypothetical protein